MKYIVFIALLIAQATTVYAQHEGHQMPSPQPAASPDDAVDLSHMGRMGSGTAWQPESTPMSMQHKQSGEWVLMFHYNLVAGVNRQGGPRGVTKFESANWFMPAAMRRVGRGTLEPVSYTHLRAH